MTPLPLTRRPLKITLPVAALMMLFICAIGPTLADSTIEFMNPGGLFKPSSFSQVATAKPGKIVFISGQTARDEQANVVGTGDVRKQAQKVFENLRLAVGAAGGSMDDIAKITTYIVGLKSEDRIWIGEMIKLHFHVPPAHTLVGISALAAPELLVEVEAIAVID